MYNGPIFVLNPNGPETGGGGVVFNVTGSSAGNFNSPALQMRSMNYVSFDCDLRFGSTDTTASLQVQVANLSGGVGPTNKAGWGWKNYGDVQVLKGVSDSGIIRAPVWEDQIRVAVSGSGLGSGSLTIVATQKQF